MSSQFSTYQLGEVAEIIAGGDKPKVFSLGKKASVRVPVLANAEKNNGLMGYTDNARIFEPAVTVAARGSNVGFVAVRKEPFFPIVRLLSLIPKKNCLDVDYLFYNLKQNRKTGTGSGQPQITIPDISSKTISLPPISIQQKVAEVLSVLDKKIELNNRINAELEAMAKTLYDYWFVQFDFPDDSPQGQGKPYKTSGGKMVYNPTLKREIPEGWEVKKLSQHLTLGSGFPFDSSTYQENGKYKVITIKNVQSEGLETDKTDFVDSVPKGMQDFCVLNIGDILMSLTGNVGRVCIVNEEDLLLNQRVGKFVCDKKWKNYFYLYFLRPESRARLEKIATGSSQKNLSPIDAVNFLHVYPSEELLNKFNEATKYFIEQIVRNSLENRKLASLRDWLLPMLMNGQVTVGEDA